MRSPKSFTLVATIGASPTHQEALALFTRAAEVIELRGQTSCNSIETLEDYARSVARAGGLALVATRRADWHKPFVERTNPHGLFGYHAGQWAEQQRKQRAEYPHIKIMDATVIQSIENAENQLWLTRHGRYGKPNGRRRRVSQERPLHERLVDQRSVLWVARELPGVSEITLLPTSTLSQRGTYPITITLATAEGLEDVCRAIRLLGEGKRPYEATTQTLVEAGKERGLTETQAMQAHYTRRVEPYRALWKRVCRMRKYGNPKLPILPCVCAIGRRASPRTLGEMVRQMAERIINPEVHEAACYERTIDVLTCWPDFWLARNEMLDKVGERHILISYYSKKLAEARKQTDVEHGADV